MKSISVYLIIIALLTTASVKGQVKPEEIPLVLENLYNRFIDNYDDISRIRINDSIRTIIESFVTSDTVFTHRFSNLRYLGQITSPDSLIKIIAWNLVLISNPNRYFCYFIKKSEAGEKNRIYSLTSAYNEEPVITDTTYSSPDWYGALYYDIKPFETENNKCWILLGIDYGNPFISRKIIEVLSFDPDGSIILGKKWFVAIEKIKFRVVFEYASNAMMSLRFVSDSSIVFDHLVPFSPSLKDDRQYYGPDYSFDAYNFADRLWRLTINVDARNKE